MSHRLSDFLKNSSQYFKDALQFVVTIKVKYFHVGMNANLKTSVNLVNLKIEDHEKECQGND